MSNVYKVGSDRRLVIYYISNYILARTVYQNGMDRPIYLANDYLDGLTETVFNETIYYAYQNQERNVYVRNIMSPNNLYTISSESNPDILCPQLVVVGEKLLLYYMLRNPLNETLSLKCVLPLESGVEVEVPKTADNIDMYDILKSQGKAFLVLDSIYRIDKVGGYSRLTEHVPYELKASETIAGDSNLAYREKIQEQNAVIESIKNQYAELMEIASEYRKEAIKWRSKFM